MRSLLVFPLAAILACASGGAPAGEAPKPSARTAAGADSCGGLYALDVRNDGDAEVWFSFTDEARLKPERRIGTGPVRAKDATTLFFQSPDYAPHVWALVRDGVPVWIGNRAALQRYRIRVILRCDTP